MLVSFTGIFYPKLIKLNRKSLEIYLPAVISANEADYLSQEFRLDSWGGELLTTSSIVDGSISGSL